MKKIEIVFLSSLFFSTFLFANLFNCTTTQISKNAPLHGVFKYTNAVASCPNGFTYDSNINTCIDHGHSSTDFRSANNTCRNEGGELPSPNEAKRLDGYRNQAIFSNKTWYEIRGGCGGYPRTDYVETYLRTQEKSKFYLWWCNGIHYKYPRAAYYCVASPRPPKCPSGYSKTGLYGSRACRTTVQVHYCTGLNSQGSPWYLQGNKCVSSAQICDMGCASPLVFDKNINKCVISYSNMCSHFGEVYNSSLHKCVRQNQCNDPYAYKDSSSNYCAINSNCPITNGSGKCEILPIRTCRYNNYYYSSTKQECLANNQCSPLEYVNDTNYMCDSQPYCKKGDTQLATKCKDVKDVYATCGADARRGNMCYIANHGTAKTSTYKPMITGAFTGNFKSYEYGKIVNAMCTNNSSIPCKFRLTNIYASGNNICFTDARGVKSCFTTNGECTFTGQVNDILGIKQIRVNPINNQQLIINGISGKLFKPYSSQVNSCSTNMQTACKKDSNGFTQYSCPATSSIIESSSGLYSCINKANVTNVIDSNCALSAKVGQYNKPYNKSDIIAAKSVNGAIQFWDPYIRGYIGNISILPKIPSQDSNNGYSYKSPDEAKLLREGFTGFTYLKNAIPNSTQSKSTMYAVYNGTISKAKCESLIKGTSFAIAYATNQQQEDIIKGLSLESNKFNCVVSSNSAIPFSQQKFSIKVISSPTVATNFVCSPLKCSNHECQYNQCPTNFNGSVYLPDAMNNYLQGYNASHGTAIQKTNVCTGNVCDSNLPYLPYCGNKSGCANRPDVYQQNNGTCAKITCPQGTTYNRTKGECEKYGCVNSIEKDGRCYKTISVQ